MSVRIISVCDGESYQSDQVDKGGQARQVRQADEDCIATALEVLRLGGVLAIPTDTVYGLAADAANAKAVQELFVLKDRPAERSIAVLVTDLMTAERLVCLSRTARRLAEEFWPGPLTLVAQRTPTAPPHLGTRTTLGVRLPDDDLVRHLTRSGPLAVTSANLHGAPTPVTAQELAQIFPSLSLVIDGGRLPGMASTVVDVTGSTPSVLREGLISVAQIMAVG